MGDISWSDEKGRKQQAARLAVGRWSGTLCEREKETGATPWVWEKLGDGFTQFCHVR